MNKFRGDCHALRGCRRILCSFGSCNLRPRLHGALHLLRSTSCITTGLSLSNIWREMIQPKPLTGQFVVEKPKLVNSFEVPQSRWNTPWVHEESERNRLKAVFEI